MNSPQRLLLVLLLAVATLTVAGQRSRFRVMTYNVENLFDTCHDEGFDDSEFLPAAERHWGTLRYRAKLAAIARVIVTASGDAPIDLVALCEVENDSVVRDLCERTALARLGYRYVVTHSRDHRGLDVALLYHPLRFGLLTDSAYVVPFVPAYGRPTRDLLHVSGMIITGDTLDVFVCHMPSHRSDAPATEDLSQTAMETLRHHADSLLNVRRRAYVVMMGDFNADYASPIIANTLGARAVAAAEDGVGEAATAWYVLSAGSRAANRIEGTYKYRGRWSAIDKIIVSASLLDSEAPIHARIAPCRIFAPAFLLLRDRVNGGVKPNRTFIGTHYHGGYSDHLPLIADFWY